MSLQIKTPKLVMNTTIQLIVLLRIPLIMIKLEPIPQILYQNYTTLFVLEKN